MKHFYSLCLLFLISTTALLAQQNFPVNGLTNDKSLTYAFINAKIYIDYKTVIEKGTLLIKEDKVIDAGTAVIVPKEAMVIDLNGKTIYPSFIDVYSDYGTQAIEKQKQRTSPQYETATEGAYGWNEAIRSDYDAFLQFKIDPKTAESYRKAGFGTVMSLRKDGICRGSSVAVSLRSENANKAILKERAGACYSFSKGSSGQQYPSSLMGSIALLRQTYYDAKWYAIAKDKEQNISLETWIALQNLPQFFEVNDKLDALRAAKIANEFGATYIIKASGNEYQRLDEIKASKFNYILPLNFPEALDLSDPYDALNVSLATLKEWEMAPANPSFFEHAAINFAFTADGLKDKSTFLKQVIKAIKYGLSEEQALKALLQTPAEMMQINNQVGALKKGMLANFIITSENVFDAKNVIYENWIQGNRYPINEMSELDIRGNYQFVANNQNFKLQIYGPQAKLKFDVLQDTTKYKSKVQFQKNELTMRIEIGKKDDPQSLNVVAIYKAPNFIGNLQDNDGNWQAIRIAYVDGNIKADKKDTTDKSLPELGAITYPFCAYGFSQMPQQQEVIIKNATVWTNEQDGILTETDVWFKDGKIVKIGKSVSSPTATVIDGKGMHLTSGIVDEHSHIAATGNVNEGSHSVTSEVRIADIIDCDDINIYRQLAGGVTSSQILHGSANAIGGQAQLLKLRWGKNPEQLKFEGADPFIKFALGENVKQTNWGERYTIRYPQTRMGVEQTVMQAFTQAAAYQAELKNNPTKPIRKNLQLDALVEIMNSKRFITCHSYQQGEINMLLHVADSFKFKINTFTHILEGYKVADKMKKYGAGGSTFADWWGYKYEVIEAIPYNGAIMHNMGIITAFNSDDAEMARRLNQEAAKAVKYGNVSEEEAWKFVTLNSAKLLHVDKRVGSIKVGKDADLVLWTDNPLSIYAKPIQTYVDGICYFDAARDKQLRKEMEAERSRIINKMLREKDNATPKKKPLIKQKQLQHCNEYELMPHESH